MLDKDLETFLRAKRTQGIADFFSIVAALLLGGLFYIVVTEVEESLIGVLLILACMLCGGFAAGWNRVTMLAGQNWSPVTRAELLAIIERQINHDAETLAALSDRKSALPDN